MGMKSTVAERRRKLIRRQWHEPKPTKSELKILKKHGFDDAVFAMTKRLKVQSTAMARVALAPRKHINLGVPIDGIYLRTREPRPFYAMRRRLKGNGLERFRVTPRGDDIVVEVVVDGRYFEVIREHLESEGGSVISHHVTALGIKKKMHNELDGCDATTVGRGKRQRFKRCTRAQCIV